MRSVAPPSLLFSRTPRTHHVSRGASCDPVILVVVHLSPSRDPKCDPDGTRDRAKHPLTWSGRRDSNPRPPPWQGGRRTHKMRAVARNACSGAARVSGRVCPCYSSCGTVAARQPTNSTAWLEDCAASLLRCSGRSCRIRRYLATSWRPTSAAIGSFFNRVVAGRHDLRIESHLQVMVANALDMNVSTSGSS